MGGALETRCKNQGRGILQMTKCKAQVLSSSFVCVFVLAVVLLAFLANSLVVATLTVFSFMLFVAAAGRDSNLVHCF